MKTILKRGSHAVVTGLLIACMVMAPVAFTGCNPTAAVNLVVSLATNLLASCAGFGLNPVDAAACSVAAGAVNAAGTAFDTCYNAYEASKTSGGTTLQAFEACAQSELTNISATLAAFKISNSTVQGYIVTAIDLIISTVEIVLSYFGISTAKQMAHANATVGVSKVHSWNDARKAKDTIKVKWNTQVCAHVTNAACLVK